VNGLKTVIEYIFEMLNEHDGHISE